MQPDKTKEVLDHIDAVVPPETEAEREDRLRRKAERKAKKAA